MLGRAECFHFQSITIWINHYLQHVDVFNLHCGVIHLHRHRRPRSYTFQSRRSILAQLFCCRHPRYFVGDHILLRCHCPSRRQPGQQLYFPRSIFRCIRSMDIFARGSGVAYNGGRCVGYSGCLYFESEDCPHPPGPLKGENDDLSIVTLSLGISLCPLRAFPRCPLRLNSLGTPLARRTQLTPTPRSKFEIRHWTPKIIGAIFKPSAYTLS